MTAIGIVVHAGQTAAALCQDGRIVAAVAEERFDRIKRSRAFPRRSIEFCLGRAGIANFNDLETLAVAWNPARNMEQINLSGFTSWRRYDPEWLYIVPNQILSMRSASNMVGTASRLHLGGKGPNILFVDHHWAHMAHAAFQSPFERGAIAIVDEYGESASVTLGRFLGNRLEVLRTIPYPHSLGVFFSAVTEFLGFTANCDEWKVMGAAAYGDSSRFQAAVEALIPWDERRQEWWVDQRYIQHANMRCAGYCSETVTDLLGIAPRAPDAPFDQTYFDLAAAAQAVFEDRLFHLLRSLAAESGEESLVAAGGCFMNSLANGRILAETPFRHAFIPYAAADNGTAMGAALYAHYVEGGNKWEPESSSPSPYIGPDCTNTEAEAALAAAMIPSRRMENPAETVASLIAQGNIVGWVNGAMEFGERALGARSILADPRDPAMKDRINAAVKFREGFRPFAPSVPQERAAEFFELPAGTSVPYMEMVHAVRPEKRSLIPSIVHGDGSARVHTVASHHAPAFHNLLCAFERHAGVPVILNTSFNVAGEPIVCSARDAIRTFYSSGLNHLVIADYLVSK